MSIAMLCLTTFVACLVGSFVPLVNTEIVVLAAAAAVPPGLLLPVALIAAVAQMGGKSVLYLAGGGMLRLPVNRLTRRLHDSAAAGAQFERSGPIVLFASAFTGFPPLYLTSIASGAVHLPFPRFLVIGFVGRLLRFGALVMVPQAVKVVL
jgi:membrane protein YqaA with SNARE-associated domain